MLNLACLFLPFGSTNAIVEVQISTQDEWMAPPLVLQIIEFVASEPGHDRYAIIEYLHSKDLLKKERTSQEVFDSLISDESFLPFLESENSIPFLKASLASNALAPIIQTYHQYYRTTVVPSMKIFESSCSVWVEYHKKQFCDLEILMAYVDTNVTGNMYILD